MVFTLNCALKDLISGILQQFVTVQKPEAENSPRILLQPSYKYQILCLTERPVISEGKTVTAANRATCV